ncbi:MAG: ABC transporter substrate-binding protein [Actinobacteria bacterium]|nr:ABC transporter substrate-binding protein [Actinomycetota bacterium]
MKKTFVLLLTFILTIFCISCSAAGTGETADIVRIGDSTGDWGFPSPYGMYSRGPGYIRMSLIFDTLIWKDKEGNVIPMLAESYDYDEEGNTYTFKLREDIKWHDGEPFDASDVIFTFNYIKEHPWVWVDPGSIKSVTQDGSYVVKIALNKKYAPFLNNIAGTLPIIPEHIWKNIREPLSYTGDDALTGTGPFILKDYNNSEGSYLYEANPGYYYGRVNIEKLVFVKVSGETTPAMLESGEIDAGSIPADVAEDLKDKGFIMEEEPPVWAAKLIINHHSNDLLKEKSFRHALAYAIDRKQIVEISQRGFAVEGSAGLMPPANSLWYNENIPQYEYSIEKTRQLIEDLGWTEGEGGYYSKDGDMLSLELAVSQGDFERDGQIVKENLEKAGIKIDLVSYESKTLDNMIENWNFDLAISGHGGLGGDPESLNSVVIDGGFNSVRYYENEELVGLMQAQLEEMDTMLRKEMVYEIQEMYAEELPSITLYYPKWFWAHNEKANIFYTEGGISTGIPIPINKIAFLEK